MVFTKYPKHGITLFIGFGKVMHPSMFQVMKSNVFLKQHVKGIVGVLFSFEDEQYISNSIDPWCLIIEYPNEGIGFLVGFGRVLRYSSTCQNICYGAQCIYGYLEKGNAYSLTLFGHEQYPSKNLNQNNLAHDVYNVA
jgi:hypothetical protein